MGTLSASLPMFTGLVWVVVVVMVVGLAMEVVEEEVEEKRGGEMD